MSEWKFIENTDYGTYWMEKQWDDNLFIRTEFLPEKYDSKLFKEHLDTMMEELPKRGLEENYCQMVMVLMNGYLEYVKENEGKLIDVGVLDSQVHNGACSVYEGTSIEDCEQYCRDNEDFYNDDFYEELK